MKKVALASARTEQLVELFAMIGVAQDEALLGNEIAKFNRLFDRMAAVSSELKSRQGDHRRELRRLYSYDNMQVRLKAAIHTLAVLPDEALEQLRVVAASDWFPQAGDAGMSLWNLERGVFKPT